MAPSSSALAWPTGDGGGISGAAWIIGSAIAAAMVELAAPAPAKTSASAESSSQAIG
jgi:hypothetical protein